MHDAILTGSSPNHLLFSFVGFPSFGDMDNTSWTCDFPSNSSWKMLYVFFINRVKVIEIQIMATNI